MRLTVLLHTTCGEDLNFDYMYKTSGITGLLLFAGNVSHNKVNRSHSRLNETKRRMSEIRKSLLKDKVLGRTAHGLSP